MNVCKPYTIQEIRETLGSIVSKLFTESYNLKYHTFVVGLGNDLQPFISAMIDNSAETDIAIGNLYYSSCISEKEVDKIIENTSPVILACIFYRYRILTQYFSSIDQASVLTLPIDSEHFFLELLINYWKEACQHISL